MKKEDFVSTLVMTTVSILMLVGVTIAWYTAVYAHPTVTGMNMEAAEVGGIKIALKAGGEDIADEMRADLCLNKTVFQLQKIVFCLCLYVAGQKNPTPSVFHHEDY